LDLGCGTGRPIAEYVLARGYRLTGVDQAEELLKLAQSRLPGATWIHSPIESFVSATPFNAIICWDALFHIDRGQHETLLARFAEMLAPGGRLMLTFGGSDHPAFTDQMFGQTFFYDSHPPERALALLAAQGFIPVISEFTNLPTGGRDKGRYAFVGRSA
jgi:predicted TPR repeat methyltransferase